MYILVLGIGTRPSEEAFTLLFEKLRRDPVKFFNYFRMSISTFDELLTTYLRLISILKCNDYCNAI